MTNAGLDLAVDCGQGGTRTMVLTGQQSGARYVTAGLREGSIGSIVDSLSSAAGSLSRSVGRIHAMGCCSTGIELANVEQMTTVAAGLADRTGAQVAVVTDDSVASHLGALSGRAGVVVAAGTGVCALALRDDGTFATADGWGYLVDDAGAGFWIGRRGLQAAVRHEDGRGGCSCLHEAATARYGRLAAAVFRIQVAPDRAALVAAFATDVADVARGGCQQARQIWEDAGRHLAHTSVAAAAAVERRPGKRQWSAAGEGLMISWAGSVFAAGDLITDSFAAIIAEELPAAAVVAPDGDALAGSAQLIRLDFAATPHASLVGRWEATNPRHGTT